VNPSDRRFVLLADALRESNAWTHNEWLCRPDVVAADKLLLVRAHMPAHHCHPFHRHPHREEIIYVISGRAEQWVGSDHRILHAGEIAHIPPGTVHGTFNPHDEPLVFLALLSPAKLPGRPRRRARPGRCLASGTLGLPAPGSPALRHPRLAGGKFAAARPRFTPVPLRLRFPFA
jgi:quercetin dioxygenase-like cupin family protein